MQHNIATKYDASLNFAAGIKIYDFSWAIKGFPATKPLFACRVTPHSRQVSYSNWRASRGRNGAGRSQTLICTANRSQWRSVEGDRAFKLVEVSRLRSSSNTLPRLGYAAVNCSADASGATAIDQSSLRSRILGVPEIVALSRSDRGIHRSISNRRFDISILFRRNGDIESPATFYATNKMEQYLYHQYSW